MAAPYRVVIEDAFEDERLRTITSFEMTYMMNRVGGRPSDNARNAVTYVRRALADGNDSALASPTAKRMFADYLGESL